MDKWIQAMIGEMFQILSKKGMPSTLFLAQKSIIPKYNFEKNDETKWGSVYFSKIPLSYRRYSLAL